MNPPDHTPPHRRRDPAWVWYAVAAAVLVAMLAAEFSGLLDRLGP